MKEFNDLQYSYPQISDKNEPKAVADLYVQHKLVEICRRNPEGRKSKNNNTDDPYSQPNPLITFKRIREPEHNNS